MDYNGFFTSALNKLHDEGNYRVFADLERHRGNFPTATNHGDQKREVTIWCSNDYLGMGQHPDVIAAKNTHEESHLIECIIDPITNSFPILI